MASGTDSGSDSSSQDPYVRLSISRDASFEGVQQARDRALAAAGDDPQERARVEAAYDAVLMERLRERQSGRVSSAAATASQREQQVEAAAPMDRGVPGALLTRLRQFSLPSSAAQAGSWMPELSLVEGQGLMVRGLAGAAGLGLLLFAVGSAELVLSIGTIGVFLSQIRRGRRPLAALGWSVLLLSVGLVLGASLLALVPGAAAIGWLSPEQVQALPAALLLWAGALLLA